MKLSNANLSKNHSTIKEKSIRFLFVCALLFLTVSAILAQQRLIMVGGGTRPPEAIARMVEWAGGEKARILIITWASGEPQASFDGIKKNFNVHKIASFENAPIRPIDSSSRQQFLSQLKTSTAVFFTGGDQNRIMDVLKDTELLNALRESYNSGVVFGGTSAGTAIMTTPMMTGEADLTKIYGANVGTREGLGLLPNVIADQHFIKRQRENRLFSLLLLNPKMLGIGIDEDAALLVKDNRFAEVAGPTPVMFVKTNNREATFLIHLLRAGGKYDLKKHKVIK